MDPSTASLFDLASKRLAWTGERQAVLAQNVANAQTPGFMPRDLTPFARVLAGQQGGLALTDSRHLAAKPGQSSAITALRPQARSPDGNAVSIEQELTKIADTQGAQALTGNLVQRYMTMFRTTLGK